MGKKQIYRKLVEREREFKEMVSGYLDMKKAEGVTHFTLEIQAGMLNRFFRDVSNCGDDTKQWKKEIQIYLADKKSAYYNKLLDCLRQFFSYCVEEGTITNNPCSGIRYKKPVSRIVDHSEDVIEKLLKAPDKSTFSGLRDYSLILLILDTGIRPHEALQLRVSDVHIQEKFIHIREEVAKTRQSRFLPLSIPMVQAIKKLINVRHSQWDEDGTIFCNHFGKRMDTHSLQDRFRKYSDAIGEKITSYMLRHCFALYFIRNGGDPFALQRIMGHTRLDQTKEYVSIARADITNGHAKASPLNTFVSEQKKVVKLIKRR